MVNIIIEDRKGSRQAVEVPTDMGFSLMEILKANEYEVLATCGGMALCATCHVEVLDGIDRLSERNDAEFDMLDTLPDATENSRLACQLRVSPEMEGMIFRIKGEYN